jgi:UDP-N-acetyl-D-mannosaminuronic acid transferase (WecB/TagA/CpsF family)
MNQATRLRETVPRQVVPTDAFFRVLGIRVHSVRISDVITHMQLWIAMGQVGHYVAFTGLHGVSVANTDSEFKAILNSADLVVTDGMPLVWLGRLHGHLGRVHTIVGPR